MSTTISYCSTTLSTNLSLDIFSPEDEAMEPSDPLRSLRSPQTITQTIQPPTNSAETLKSADQGITGSTTQESRTINNP
ncbi:hypothetical protein RO3G_16745 [Rhizopus delemar RA 99-880]|uniref:Uncharacterized protein n=1 Tax=Rhizopus delemar (strain RA 99-880 / ATCC MYA-4621 / FGSC 9543 / NRRL 43880) TaxID=246409 RepID=I1CUA4_RHIO9|nr:hypothetical protein RO3G_16745 [Rhizopus delemar RA 99-880]|eukprot:EIE92034.1 hypothetical protein RO3G_16745 [Rhizopus delemar RA 99-880]